MKLYYKNGMRLLLEYCSYSMSRLATLNDSLNKGSSPGLVLSLRHLNSINSFYINVRGNRMNISFKNTLTAQAMYESCLKKPCNNFTALQKNTK